MELKAGQIEEKQHPAGANTLGQGKGEKMAMEWWGLVPSPAHTQGLPFSCPVLTVHTLSPLPRVLPLSSSVPEAPAQEDGIITTLSHLSVSPEMLGYKSPQVATEHEEAQMLKWMSKPYTIERAGVGLYGL